MQRGGNEDATVPRRNIARLRVLTITRSDVKATHYRIEMKLVEGHVLPRPYIHTR
jgi:hypothetical protein